MIPRRAAATILTLVLAMVPACATPGAAPQAAPPCAGFQPPAAVVFAPAALPATWVSARAAAEVTDEIVIGRTGAVSGIRFLRSNYAFLAPFAEESIQHSRFSPASIEGNPVAVRVEAVVQVGSPGPTRASLPYDGLRAFVPGGQSREARWQLAASVERLTLVAHVGTVSALGVSIVAIAPSGAEKSLLALPAAPAPQESRETVGTGRFLDTAGDYRLELRAGGKALATTTVTIAAGFETAIINACEPIRVSK